MCFSVFTSVFSLYAERRYVWHGRPFGPREIGYLFAAYSGFLGLLLQGGLIGRLVKRFGERSLVNAGYLSLVMDLASSRRATHCNGLGRSDGDSLWQRGAATHAEQP